MKLQGNLEQHSISTLNVLRTMPAVRINKLCSNRLILRLRGFEPKCLLLSRILEEHKSSLPAVAIGYDETPSIESTDLQYRESDLEIKINSSHYLLTS